MASAWSVRPTPDARVSMPLEWDEVADCDPAAFTLATAPARFAERGDAAAGIDSAAGSLDALLDLSASQEAAGLGDAPWPPHYKKQRDEPSRVAPSRRKASAPSTEHRGHRESTQPLITVAKAARKADALGRPGIRKRRRACTWTMSSSTRCAAARPTGLASGSICATFPTASARQKIRPNLTMIPGRRRRAADYGRAPKTRSSS